jgi:hypothetical protein
MLRQPEHCNRENRQIRRKAHGLTDTGVQPPICGSYHGRGLDGASPAAPGEAVMATPSAGRRTAVSRSIGGALKQKRVLDHTLEVSVIGLGCMGMSQSYGPAPDRPELISL